MYNPTGPLQGVGIGNSYEFHYRTFLRKGSIIPVPPRKDTYAASAEMALFWCGREVIVLAPQEIAHEFLSDISQALKLSIQHACPEKPTGFLCSDFNEDELNRLILPAIGSDFVLLPYGVTPQFYELLNKLRTAGLIPRSRTYPLPEDYWTVDFIDSKTGGRAIFSDIAKSIEFFSVPFGILAETPDQVLVLQP